MGDAVLVRLTPEAGARVDERAAAAGLTRAAWVRARVVEATDLPLEEARPSKPRRIPDEDLALMSMMIGDYGKLSGRLVQCTAALRVAGAHEAHAEAEAVLADMKAMQKAQVALKRRLEVFLEALKEGVE